MSIETDNEGKIYRNADTNSEHYLSSVSGTLESPTELGNNQWGFSITDPSTNSNKFSAVPTTKTNIKESNSGVAVNSEETTIYYGIKADGTLPSGNYNGTIIYTTTPNPACFAYTIHFNSGSGTPTYPSKNLTYSESIDLSTYSPTLNGYVFAGWSDGTKTYKGTVSATDLNPSNQAEITLTAQYFQIKEWKFNYTGASQTFTVPEDGIYRIELWGASGANAASFGGKGGYAAGEFNITSNMLLFIYVGATGQRASNSAVFTPVAFNGGGTASYSGGAGGGATDVRLIGDTWNDATSLGSRLMVAGAGGGSGAFLYKGDGPMGGYGGGLMGGSSCGHSGDPFEPDLAYGTQNNGGTPPTYRYSQGGYGTFGIGGKAGAESWYAQSSGGGGGGYYGGAGGSERDSGGGGGSSYISGHTGAVAITSESNQSPKSGCATGTTNNDCSIHYSGHKFTNTKMIDGAGYAWTNVKGAQEQMPNPAGGYYALGTGHTGNGYARITLIGK